MKGGQVAAGLASESVHQEAAVRPVPIGCRNRPIPAEGTVHPAVEGGIQPEDTPEAVPPHPVPTVRKRCAAGPQAADGQTARAGVVRQEEPAGVAITPSAGVCRHPAARGITGTEAHVRKIKRRHSLRIRHRPQALLPRARLPHQPNHSPAARRPPNPNRAVRRPRRIRLRHLLRQNPHPQLLDEEDVLWYNIYILTTPCPSASSG